MGVLPVVLIRRPACLADGTYVPPVLGYRARTMLMARTRLSLRYTNDILDFIGCPDESMGCP